jgi:S-adenosylmethionine synthetase
MTRNYTFTSESVSRGHPDKVADQISDALVDAALLRGDDTTRCGIETLVTTNMVTLAGEVKNFNLTRTEVDEIVRNTVRGIEYPDGGNFQWDALKIHNALHAQSADIRLGTDDFGAGDQGIMFGYASSENPDYMPTAIFLAHGLLHQMDTYRQNGTYNCLLPDAKSQISVEYNGSTPSRIASVVCSHQHTEGNVDNVREAVRRAAVDFGSLGQLIDNDTQWLINPTGNFVIGGPDGDAGVTGRKIIVDTYGGYAPHGGGAFSGKDPSKVDRSGAYAARWLAKNVVASNMASWCQIQLSYAIGVKEPVSIYVDSDGHNPTIEKFIRNNVDLTPKGIIDRFDLFNFTEYSANCVYGHFGNKNVPWEKIGW